MTHTTARLFKLSGPFGLFAQRAVLALALLVALAVPAFAHPHEWYSVTCEIDLGDGHGEARLTYTLTPDPFTNGVLYQLGDRNSDQTLDADELRELTDAYSEGWRAQNWFAHPLQNGEPCRPIRCNQMEFVQVEAGVVEGLPRHVIARIEVMVPLIRPQEYSTLNLMFCDLSAYTALTFVKRDLQPPLVVPGRVEITGVSQSHQTEVRVLYHVLPAPAPAPGAATDAPAAPVASVAVTNLPASADDDEVPTRTWWEWVQDTGRWLSGLLYSWMTAVKEGISPLALLTLLAIAFGWGVIHALGPGHGKLVMASYIMRTDGKYRDVVKLALIFAYVHTGVSIAIVGLVGLAAMTIIAFSAGGEKSIMDGAQGWLGLVSGALVVLVGGWLMRLRMRGHHHDDDEEEQKLRDKSLARIAIALGMVPCPAAMLIMIMAAGMGVFHIGVLVVVALAAGIATVLMAVGVVVLHGRRQLMGRLRAHSVGLAPAGKPAFATVVPAAGPAGPVLALAGADGFTREHEIEWLDDDEPAPPADSPASAAPESGPASGFTREDEIEWLDDDATATSPPPAAGAAEVTVPELSPEALKWLDRVEDTLAYIGGTLIIVFGFGIAWYYAHLVLLLV
ncbi:MAG: DUF1007 family protein [Planctomycetota bacterium]